MDNKIALKHMTYPKYLQEKRRKADYIEKCNDLMKRLQKHLDSESMPDALLSFANTFESLTKITAGFQFLYEYSVFCEADDPEFAEAIRQCIDTYFDKKARVALTEYRRGVVLIPGATKIRSELLADYSNDEFVAHFKAFQEMVIAVYHDMERTPRKWDDSEWGNITMGGFPHNRLINTLSIIANSGELDGTTLVVDKKVLRGWDRYKDNMASRMLAGLTSMGFNMEGLDDKKAKTFTFAYPPYPFVIPIMYLYYKDRHTSHIPNASYRFIQDPTTQKYDAHFLFFADKMADIVRDIHYRLYDEGAKYGYANCTYNTYDFVRNDHIWYEKDGSYRPSYKTKKYFLVYGLDTANVVMRFSNIFKSHPEKADELINRFPHAFAADVKDNTFTFENVNLDDVMFLFEMHKLENKLKIL